MSDGGADHGISLLFDVFVLHQRVHQRTSAEWNVAVRPTEDALSMPVSHAVWTQSP